MLWQLKKLSTNETLNEPQKLPENWGPIFGMSGIQDKLSDLSWLGDAYADQGWFVVGDAPAGPAQTSEADLAWERAKSLLRDSDWSMLPDVPMLASKKDLWIEYRRALRDIRLQSGFPVEITWPIKPA
jgi:hypothetical protein